MADERILITGALGKVGRMLRPLLARPGRTLRLLDLGEAPGDLAAGEEYVRCSVTELDALTEACRGVDAVVHLGGRSGESDVDDILHNNILGTHHMLLAAQRAGVTRVVLASSNHAAGFHQRATAPETGVAGDAPPRPDTLYGWSKAAGEAAGRLFADRYGMDVICLRIGQWTREPQTLRSLALWLSPADGARLVEACLSADSPGFRIVWGVSRNTRRWTDLAQGEAIGYDPRDDAEAYADRIIAEYGDPKPDAPELGHIGGKWCYTPLGE